MSEEQFLDWYNHLDVYGRMRVRRHVLGDQASRDVTVRRVLKMLAWFESAILPHLPDES